MDDKLKRRLAGAAVLLAATFVAVSLLPTPEQSAQQGGVDVVTIPLHDVVNASPSMPTPSTALPQTLAAPAPADAADPAPASGDVGDSGDDDVADAQDPASSGDDDAPDAVPADDRKPVKLALEPALKPDSATAAAAQTEVASAATSTDKPSEAQPPPVAKPAPAPEPKPEPKPGTRPAAPTPAPSKPAEAPAKPASAAVAPKPAEVHATTPAPAAATSHWFVQVGGFADIDNARKVQTRLQSISQPTILAPIDNGKGTIYRVRAGPYASEIAAQQAFERIKALGYPGSQLVTP
ncbi:SPOR domain-containing protein [Solimonas terrae]|uniref:SPOR domain-containing protein n=1 Tax=Solimonas terrae TaxID=1396819 RepID=A0A6M2BV36_9GAMM|nr:SPOR domain-containing protein [Solimonas terrae]NGY06220.1 hypothetical protein [Solimonas terrae]